MPLYAYLKPVPVPAALAGGEYRVSLSVERVDGEALAPAELRKIRAALAAPEVPSAPAVLLAKTTARQATEPKAGRSSR